MANSRNNYRDFEHMKFGCSYIKIKLSKFIYTEYKRNMYLILFHTMAILSDLDFARSTGKIYTVVAVILILFLGIAIFLFRLDKKISDLEKKIRK
jgi:uncharacterized membrane protein YkvI